MLEAIWTTIQPYVVGAIKGFGSGVVAAGIGYLKRPNPEEDPFDGVKFTRVVLIGGITQALGEGFGITSGKAEEYLAYPVVVYFIDATATLIWRRALQPFYEKIKEYF